MTPKEKATDLIEKMWSVEEKYGSIGSHEAKQCALIVVDEIEAVIGYQLYWQEVREEIEKL